MNREWSYLKGALVLLLPLVMVLGCLSNSKAALGAYKAKMSVEPIPGSGQYRVELSIWREVSDGTKAYVSEPELVVAEGQEADVEIRSGVAMLARCLVVVKETDGRKVATATVQCFEDSIGVWQDELRAEAAPRSD